MGGGPPCILLVEDEFLLALHMAELLTLEGYRVAGPARAVPQALALIAAGGIDAALLDLDLGGVPASPVAQALAERGIPFAFLSGHGADRLPAAFAGRPLVTKPAMPEALLQAVQALLARP